MAPKENLLCTNLYTYCDNEPVLGYDPTGMGSVAFIGAGIQIELGIGQGSGGMEVIWFTSTRVNVKGKKRTIPYVYLYAGIGVSRSAKTTKLLNKLIDDIVKKPALLFHPKSLKSGGISFSVCIFAIFGYSNFRSPKYYLGEFDEAYGSVSHIKAFKSWSGSCVVYGAGWSSSSASIGRSKSFYCYASTVIAGIQKLYNSVVAKAKTLGR